MKGGGAAIFIGRPMRGAAGFSLIEIIAALVLVLVIAALSLPIWTSGVLGAVGNRERIVAAYDLRATLEQLMLVGAGFAGDTVSEFEQYLTANFAVPAGVTLGFSDLISAHDLPVHRVVTLSANGAELSYVFAGFSGEALP